MRNYKAWLSVLRKQWLIAEKNNWGLSGDLLEMGNVMTRTLQGQYYSEEEISGKKIEHLALFERGLHRGTGMLWYAFFAQAIMISMFLTALLLSVSYFLHIFPIIIFAVSLTAGLIIEFMCRGDKYE